MINSDRPLISIVTPSYNQGKFIENTILSVKNQDYSNIEHIIIDGGSRDNTLSILEKYEGTYNIRWISEPDEGQADAVNKGFEMAKGEIVGWLNSDDVYFTRDVIRRVITEFLKRPTIDLVYGDRVEIDEENRLLRLCYSRKFEYQQLLKAQLSIYQETVFFRKKVVDKYRLDKKYRLALDTEFWLRIGEHCHFYYLNSFLGGIRRHPMSKSASLSNIEDWKKERHYLKEKYNRNVRLRDESKYFYIVFAFFRKFLEVSYYLFSGRCIHVIAEPIQIVSYTDKKLAWPVKVNGWTIFWLYLNKLTKFFGVQ